MTHDTELKEEPRTEMIGVRLDTDQKKLVDDAAKREGLQTSSFLIMLLVRAHILPSSCLRKIKRRPVPLFNELHKLIGTINKVGGNCKQLADALPHTAGLRSTHFSINRAAEAVLDAIQGKPIPATVNLLKFEKELTDTGYAFNAIVRSVNMGKPQLSGLRIIIGTLANISDAITSALTGEPVAVDTASIGGTVKSEPTTDTIRTSMKKSAKASTKRNKGDV